MFSLKLYYLAIIKRCILFSFLFFRAKVVVFNIEIPIIKGTTCVLHYGSVQTQVSWLALFLTKFCSFLSEWCDLSTTFCNKNMNFVVKMVSIRIFLISSILGKVSSLVFSSFDKGHSRKSDIKLKLISAFSIKRNCLSVRRSLFLFL